MNTERRASEAVRAQTRGQHRIELPQRGFALAERGEVVAVDDRIVRRVVERFTAAELYFAGFDSSSELSPQQLSDALVVLGILRPK